ncbi:MAG: flippase-like domain-containing protein [Candidatus Omnitrophica bacterium]|nr:flippase-like domain-containing protein [Candidatus Omnitrophota bacterium]
MKTFLRGLIPLCLFVFVLLQVPFEEWAGVKKAFHLGPLLVALSLFFLINMGSAWITAWLLQIRELGMLTAILCIFTVWYHILPSHSGSASFLYMARNYLKLSLAESGSAFVFTYVGDTLALMLFLTGFWALRPQSILPYYTELTWAVAIGWIGTGAFVLSLEILSRKNLQPRAHEGKGPRFHKKLVGWLRNTAFELRKLHERRLYLKLIAASFLIQIVRLVFLSFLLQSVGHTPSLASLLLIYVFLSLSKTVQTAGGLGTWEASVFLGLRLGEGLPNPAFLAVGSHVIQWIVVGVWGALGTLYLQRTKST